MGELVEHVERVDEQDRPLGAVDRSEAIRQRWLHRIATIVVRDDAGRVLVHRRPDTSSLFPGRYNWMMGGAAEPGETYEEAATRELTEELGVRAPVRFVLKYLCRGEVSPYWLGLHEAVVDPRALSPDPTEVAWHGWLTEPELLVAVRRLPFLADSLEALDHYAAART